MSRDLTLTQLREWIAFFELEPSLTDRIGWLFASLEASVLNPHRGKKRRARPFEPKEFYRLFGDDQKPKGNWELFRTQMKFMATAAKYQEKARERKQAERDERRRLRHR